MVATDGVHDDWRHWRRLQAWRLKQQGWRQRHIAEALNVTEVSVSHWMTIARSEGTKALLSHHASGRPAKLSIKQRRLIPEFLWHGPEAYGFRGKVWTCRRVAQVIEEEFGVHYDKGHVSRLLAGLRWSPQLPIQRAAQRDEQVIERWRSEVWPVLLKEARKERRTLVFVDEAGFYLLPSVVRTYAPIGQTPVLRAKFTRDHLSVMGGMTPSGRVYTLARQTSLNGSHSIEFLRHLQRVAGRRLMVIWDGSPIHRRLTVKAYVSQSRGKVRLETLPAYAPDLNPWDEGGWHHLKNVEMRNLACRDLEELHQEFHCALGRLRQKHVLIRSFYGQAGLAVEKT